MQSDTTFQKTSSNLKTLYSFEIILLKIKTASADSSSKPYLIEFKYCSMVVSILALYKVLSLHSKLLKKIEKPSFQSTVKTQFPIFKVSK